MDIEGERKKQRQYESKHECKKASKTEIESEVKKQDKNLCRFFFCRTATQRQNHA